MVEVKDLTDLLDFLAMPLVHRLKVRTTNAMERSFREVQRRELFYAHTALNALFMEFLVI